MRLSAQLSLVFLIWLGALGCDDDGTPCLNSVTITVHLPDGSVLREYEGEYSFSSSPASGLFCDIHQSQPRNGRSICDDDSAVTVLTSSYNTLGFRLKVSSLDGQWAFDGEVPASEVQEVKQLENCISGKASVTVSAVTS